MAAIVWYRPLRRMVVEGASMAPTLLADDRLLVVRVPRWWPLRPGALVAVPDPRVPRRMLVKRLVATRDGGVSIAGDNPAASTDSRHFGALRRRSVLGPAVYRYGPVQRSGRLSARPAVHLGTLVTSW